MENKTGHEDSYHIHRTLPKSLPIVSRAMFSLYTGKSADKFSQHLWMFFLKLVIGNKKLIFYVL
jgi:hypothetical protein